ncbi:MAG: hypothetical protein XD92_0106 [Proteiniphilum acetatigenes]|uniref:Uncharacterized protein n=1 Tax=Proteiniphilum acetatigenes TaxID=294710 RepID=A0A124FXP9_9BACT|nr:MAG: hypothetical protein XD92_0106 [Proteiniphilum acetatigenes]
MLASFFPIITTYTHVSISPGFQDIHDLMVKSLLYTENVEIMKANQTIYHLFAVTPCIQAVFWGIHPDIKGGNI